MNNKKLIKALNMQLGVLRTTLASLREDYESTPICDPEVNTLAAETITMMIAVEARLDKLARL